MNELLLKRLQRRLANLPDEQGYRVLDYVEFLESKYGTRERDPTVFEKLADGVEDTLRAGRVSAGVIKGTMSAVTSASRVMERLAEAGRAAADELGRTLRGPTPPAADSAEIDEPEVDVVPADEDAGAEDGERSASDPTREATPPA